MKNVWYQPSIKENYDDSILLYRKTVIHSPINIIDWRGKRYQKVIFDIHRKALLYNRLPVPLDVKCHSGRDLVDISKHKIKMYTIDRRSRSSR